VLRSRTTAQSKATVKTCEAYKPFHAGTQDGEVVHQGSGDGEVAHQAADQLGSTEHLSEMVQIQGRVVDYNEVIRERNS